MPLRSTRLSVANKKSKDGDQEEYEVDQIIGMEDRSTIKGVEDWYFHVSWVGFANDTTWEPAKNIPAKMIAAYKRALRIQSKTEDDEREYEIDQLEDMRQKANMWEFLVSWVGYTEKTWMLEKNLPASLVKEFRSRHDHAKTGYKNKKKSPSGKQKTSDRVEECVEKKSPPGKQKTTEQVEECVEPSQLRNRTKVARTVDNGTKKVEVSKPPSLEPTEAVSDPPVLCATCQKPDGVGSKCARCQKPMHHFCANDVCVALNLYDETGEKMEQFPNDLSYCSEQCYFNERKSLPGKRTPHTSKRKRTKHYDTSESEFELSEDEHFPVPKPSSTKTVKPAISKKAKPTKQTTKPFSKQSQKPPIPPRQNVLEEDDRDPLIGRMVAFCPAFESWMPDSLYKRAANNFIQGRVCKPKRAEESEAQKIQRIEMERVRKGAGKELYEVRWVYTCFQSRKYFHRVPRLKIEEGIRNYEVISGGNLTRATWHSLCQVPVTEAIDVGSSLEDYVILDGSSDLFYSPQIIPDDLKSIEQIQSMDFQPSRQMKAPDDLYTHDDGTTETRLIKSKSHYFESASSSFLAYLPISYWNTVVEETNKCISLQKGASTTVDELLKVFGIMFYMTIVDKGEYSNYWGDQAESEIFGVGGIGMDNIMPLKRFKFIRKHLSFRSSVSPEELKKDPVARIRPLINMIKVTSTKFVELGRNVAVDESSIACRSKYGRHLIVYNSSKPTGKFHFSIYATCCATTWLMVGMRLQCNSDIKDRLAGVVSDSSVKTLEKEIEHASKVRKIVYEVTHGIHHTKRVVNMDNYYTSV